MHEQAPPPTSQSSCSHASHIRRTPHDRCDDGIINTTLTWNQFVTRSMVENITRDVRDQFVAKGETENISRGAESTEKQRRKTMRQTFYSPLHEGSIAINQQDSDDGRDNDHLHSTNSHFSQDLQKCDKPSRSSHDTRPFPLSDTVTSVDLPAWRPDDRRHNQGRRPMGSTDLTAVVATMRGGVARAGKSGKTAGTVESLMCLDPSSA